VEARRAPRSSSAASVSRLRAEGRAAAGATLLPPAGVLNVVRDGLEDMGGREKGGTRIRRPCESSSSFSICCLDSTGLPHQYSSVT
jgi:hypothetical protein